MRKSTYERLTSPELTSVKTTYGMPICLMQISIKQTFGERILNTQISSGHTLVQHSSVRLISAEPICEGPN